MKTVEELAREADQLADAEIAMPGEYHPDWHDVRDRHFRDLVLEEAAKVCDEIWQDDGTAILCREEIRAMKGQK